MNSIYFLPILSAVTILYFVIGWLTSKKISSTEEYFLAGRNVGIFPLAFTLIGAQLGSGMLLGVAQRSYDLGMFGILYAVGVSLGFVILGCGFASRLRALNINTTAEIFSKYYNSDTLKLIASGLSILSLWGILIAQVVASSNLLLGLGIEDLSWLLFFWFMLIAYTMLGGLQSVIIIDTLQVLFILAVFSFIFFDTAPISIAKLFSTKLLGKVQNYFFAKDISLFSLLPTVITPILFSLIEQDLAQKFFAAKSKMTATIASFLAALGITAFACIPMYLGLFAKYKGVKVAIGASPLVPLLEKTCSDLVFALAVCGIMAAIAATSNSILCAISSNISQDFSTYLPKYNKLALAKIVTAIAGISAVITALLLATDVISVLESSYRLSISTLFIPTVIAYFFKKLSSIAASFSMCFGFLAFVMCTLYMPYSIYQDIFCLLASAIGYGIGLMFSYQKPLQS